MKKKTKNIKKINVYNVYNAAGDNEEMSERLLRRRGGGGSSRNYDEFAVEEAGDKLDFVTENIQKDHDEEITEDDAFDDDDEEKYGLFFTKSDDKLKKSQQSKVTSRFSVVNLELNSIMNLKILFRKTKFQNFPKSLLYLKTLILLVAEVRMKKILKTVITLTCLKYWILQSQRSLLI